MQVSSRDFKPEELDQIRDAFGNQGEPASDADLEAHVTKFLIDRANANIEAAAVAVAVEAAKGQKIPEKADAAAVVKDTSEVIKEDP